MGEHMAQGDKGDDEDDADTGAEDDESVEIEPGMGEDMGDDEDGSDGGDVGGSGADVDACTLPVLGGGGAGCNWRPVTTITQAVNHAHNPLSKPKSSLPPKKRPRCS